MTKDNNNKRILIMRLGAIGDCLRVLPAVARLRQTYPHSHIAWAVEHWVHPVLQDNPLVDEFHILDRSALAGGLIAANREMRRFARTIRSNDYDVLLDFHGRFKSGWLAWRSGVPRRIGFARDDGSEGNHLFMTEQVHLSDPWENRVQRFLHLLAPLGVDTRYDPTETSLHLDDEARAFAADWLRHQTSPQLAVYPGCSQPRSKERWPLDNWIALLQGLSEEGIQSTVFWGPAEHEFATEVVEQAGSGCQLAPPTTLPQMVAMLGQCRAYVGSDTAAMHMAWMQNVPTTVFMGGKPLRTACPMPPVPYRLLREDKYYVDGLKPGKQSDQLIQAISVDTAFDAVTELLDQAQQQRNATHGHDD